MADDPKCYDRHDAPREEHKATALLPVDLIGAYFTTYQNAAE
jgi:hypothetical protein